MQQIGAAENPAVSIAEKEGHSMRAYLACLNNLGGEESKAEGGDAIAEKLTAQTSTLNQLTQSLAET